MRSTHLHPVASPTIAGPTSLSGPLMRWLAALCVAPCVSRVPQSSPYETTARPQLNIARGECVVVVRTFHGAIERSTVDAMYSLVTGGKWSLVDSSDIGPDRYFTVKGKLMHEQLPPFYLHLDMFRADSDIALQGWSTLATSEGVTR